MNWYLKCWQQFADFSGRARRKEYWMFTLFNAIVAFVISLILGIIVRLTGILALSYLSYIYTLAVLVPSLAVCVRRLHDVGKSGWMYLIGLIPIVGWIWLIVLFCTDSQKGSNQWGNNPKESEIYPISKNLRIPKS